MASTVLQPSSENPKPLSPTAKPFTPLLTYKPNSLPHIQVYQQPFPLQKVAQPPLPPSTAAAVTGMQVVLGVCCYHNGGVYQYLYYYHHHHQLPPLPLLEYAGFDVCNPRLLLPQLHTTNPSESPLMAGEEKVSMDEKPVKKIDGGGVSARVMFKKVEKKCAVREVISVGRTTRKLKNHGAVWVPKKTDNRQQQCEQEVHDPLVFDRGETTFMIRNIPNKLRREELIEILDRHCREENEKAKKRSDPVRSAYDFVYLPIDFKLLGNKGYAFVNFTTSEAATRLRKDMNKSGWDTCFESRKQCAFSVARIQGREALVKHFQDSNFPTTTDAFLPVVFLTPRDGSYPRSSPRVVGKCVSSCKW